MADEVIAQSRPSELWFPLTWIVPGAIVVGGPFGSSAIVESLLSGAVAGALSTVLYYWWWGRNRVTATDEGIVARIRGREELTYRWEDIDRLGWEPGTWGVIGGIPFGSRVLIYPTGGPYDMPGPNHPVRVGAVQPPLPWQRREVAAEVSDHLDGLMRRHRTAADSGLE